MLEVGIRLSVKTTAICVTARRNTRFTTMRTVLFVVAGKLDLSASNPMPHEPVTHCIFKRARKQISSMFE
ncbi:hypothetical protein [Caballeronia sp. LZ032]|uniref:hypothetical protein n=1 Tax=Caballeronia sp. LZ032 TaxID=3038565 RepID=UPI002866102C|nr:hypothetical protein [Caballeronia sp. LZ032]MDR5884193.1 hypothetical protein [Caballeronia sp. LZ032]